MKIARSLSLAIALALAVAPAERAFAVWPFSSSTTTTTTSIKKPVSPRTPKKPQPTMMQKMWNNVTSPFSSKPAPKKVTPLGVSSAPLVNAQKS